MPRARADGETKLWCRCQSFMAVTTQSTATICGPASRTPDGRMEFTSSYARRDSAGRPANLRMRNARQFDRLSAGMGWPSPPAAGNRHCLGTFILEDAATVIAAIQTADGSLSGPLALASLYVGIAVGDLGLYGLGWLAARFPPVTRFIPPHRKEVVRAWLDAMFKVVLISRFLPGLRLPTYTTCGFVNADLQQFALAVVIATICWTTLLFGVSLRVGEVLMDHFGAWRWAGAAGFVLFVVLAGRLTASGLQSKRP